MFVILESKLYLRKVWRYQRGNQKPTYIEGQTTQWSKDRRTDNTMVKRQKDRQHNGQKKKDKKTNNYLQNTTQKTIDRSTRTTQKPGVNPGASEGKVVLAPLVEPVVVLWLQTR